MPNPRRNSTDKNPYNLPTVLDWDDGRSTGDRIIVTTTFGLAFERGDEDTDGSHVCGFDTIGEAKQGVARKRLQKCECPRCVEGLFYDQMDSLVQKGDDNTPEADGFRSFPEWMDVTDSLDRVKPL
jgi:hypothetical protein